MTLSSSSRGGYRVYRRLRIGFPVLRGIKRVQRKGRKGTQGNANTRDIERRDRGRIVSSQKRKSLDAKTQRNPEQESRIAGGRGGHFPVVRLDKYLSAHPKSFVFPFIPCISLRRCVFASNLLIF